MVIEGNDLTCVQILQIATFLLTTVKDLQNSHCVTPRKTSMPFMFFFFLYFIKIDAENVCCCNVKLESKLNYILLSYCRNVNFTSSKKTDVENARFQLMTKRKMHSNKKEQNTSIWWKIDKFIYTQIFHAHIIRGGM